MDGKLNNQMAGGNPRDRLFLNFQGQGQFNANDRTAYPTTPSTFPQPVYQQQGQNGQVPQTPAGQQYTPGYAPQGYFTNNPNSNPYPPLQHPQQPPASYRPAQGMQTQNTYVPRSNLLQSTNNNDPTNGLAHQLSNQNLGDARANQYRDARQQVGGQRPRTAGTSGQNSHGHANNNYLSPPQTPASNLGGSNALDFELCPRERNADRYGPKAATSQKKCAQLASSFFTDSVKRARDRNVRQVELEKDLVKPENYRRREQLWSNQGKQEAKYLRFLRTVDKPDNYQTVKIIGKGAFGEVKLVTKKTDGKIYAMKSLVKTEMFKKDQLAHVRAERDILAESDSPWVVKLFTTFQDQNFLYMLMEFLPGGDLMTMLIKYEIFSEDITRFYIAEIVLAIEAVHSLGFIHRDIKPDNILLDKWGHVKLTDFGLSTGFHKLHDNSYYQQLLQKPTPSNNKRDNRMSVNLDQINLTVSNRKDINNWRKSRRVMAYSTVGTPDYIAPEIFTGNGYTFDCDWWSLGTIMFECMVGWPPFCAEEAHDTYRKIVNWRQTLAFPDDIRLAPEAENLIRSMVCNTEERLGRSGANEIKFHPFFRGVDFQSLRTISAPFCPRLSSNVDTQYFPIDEIDQTDTATHMKAAQNAAAAAGQPINRDNEEEMSLPFIGYTFKRFDHFQ